MNAVIAACKSGGLLPFANFNRIHVCPPCNVIDAEVAEGLAVLDAALAVADEHAAEVDRLRTAPACSAIRKKPRPRHTTAMSARTVAPTTIAE